MLLLRKECQPPLNAVGLNNLHIEVQDKCLVLVGECGKPLVNVKGISFSKPTINSVEREYAVELFEQFLTKYETDITVYISAKKAFSLITIPTLGTGFSTSLNSTGYAAALKTYYTASFKVGFPGQESNIEVTVNENGVSFSNAIPFTEIETLAETLRVNVSAANTFLTDMKAYTEESKRIAIMREALSACDI